MENHISKLLKLENQKAVENIAKYHKYVKLTSDMIYFLSRKFIVEDKTGNLLFKAFFSNTIVNLQLALLSILRNHDVQSCLNLRISLESLCLAVYSLSLKNIKSTNDFKNTNKAYKWIAKDFLDISKNIKLIKNKINTEFAHSNINTSACNLRVLDEKEYLCFFDACFDNVIVQRLRVVSEIVYLAMDLIEKVISKYQHGIVLSKNSNREIMSFRKTMEEDGSN